MNNSSDFYIWATEWDLKWLAQTKYLRDNLDSKEFWNMLYSEYIEDISRIIEEELWFKPDLRVASIQEFSAFKRYQKEAIKIEKSWKNINEKNRTIKDYLGIMSSTIQNDLIEYSNKEWHKMEERIANEHWIDLEDDDKINPIIWSKIDKLRDRLAAEIPVLDRDF